MYENPTITHSIFPRNTQYSCGRNASSVRNVASLYPRESP